MTRKATDVAQPKKSLHLRKETVKLAVKIRSGVRAGQTAGNSSGKGNTTSSSAFH